MNITIKTTAKRQVADITGRINSQLKDGSGLAHVVVQYTTCALSTADLDHGTDQDLLDFLDALTPQRQWHHPHDPSHAPDHLWSTIIGPSLNLPYRAGKLQLGRWQRVILIELARPRERRLIVNV